MNTQVSRIERTIRILLIRVESRDTSLRDEIGDDEDKVERQREGKPSAQRRSRAETLAEPDFKP